jgi:hypothetical protein
LARSSCIALVIGRFGLHFNRALGAGGLCTDRSFVDVVAPRLRSPIVALRR